MSDTKLQIEAIVYPPAGNQNGPIRGGGATVEASLRANTGTSGGSGALVGAIDHSTIQVNGLVLNIVEKSPISETIAIFESGVGTPALRKNSASSNPQHPEIYVIAPDQNSNETSEREFPLSILINSDWANETRQIITGTVTDNILYLTIHLYGINIKIY